MTREGVAQLQHGGRVDRVVIPNNEITPVGNVLGIVQIPGVFEGVDTRKSQPVEGEAAENVLVFAKVIVQANVKLLRGAWGQAGNKQVVDDIGRGGVARAGAGKVALGEHGQKLQGDGIGTGNLVARKCLPRPIGVVGSRRVIDGKAHVRKIARPLRAGGNRKPV